jgi:hypothetical protein
VRDLPSNERYPTAAETRHIASESSVDRPAQTPACDKVGEIRRVRGHNPVEGGPDLVRASLGVGTMCGYDETVASYSRISGLRIVEIHHDDPERPNIPFRFVPASVGLPDGQGRTLLVVAEYSAGCSSTLIHVDLRVIVVANESFTSALTRTVSARHLDDPPVRATVSTDVAELRNTADLPDGDLVDSARHRAARADERRVGPDRPIRKKPRRADR